MEVRALGEMVDHMTLIQGVYEPFAALASGMADLGGRGSFFVYTKTKRSGRREVVGPTYLGKSAGTGAG